MENPLGEVTRVGLRQAVGMLLALLVSKRPGNPGYSAYSSGAGIFRSSGVSRCGSRASMASGVVAVGRVSNR